MVEKLQRRFALSRKGAVDTIKGSLLCALQNISFMLPVYMLYCLVSDMLGGALTASRSRPRASRFTPPARLYAPQ